MITYLIWKETKYSTFERRSDIVGVFRGTWVEADAVVAGLNAADSTVEVSVLGDRYNYWKTEPPEITLTNFVEFIPEDDRR